jgi:hypothetical protein
MSCIRYRYLHDSNLVQDPVTMAPVICELPYLHHINAGAFRYIVHDYILNLPTHN